MLLGLAACLALQGCHDQRPILLGFSGQVTGYHAQLGVQARDGALLAVEEVNRRGGVQGRRLELLCRDDRGTPQGAVKANQDLIRQKVVAIIGHITSNQTLAGLPVAQKAGTLMLSPTTSTPLLSGCEDLFFRVQPSTDVCARALAKHVYQERGLASVCVVYDTTNEAYSKPYMDAFLKSFVSLGGVNQGLVTYSSQGNPDLAKILAAKLRDKPQAILIIASSLDTALFAQRIRLWGWTCPLFASGWARTMALIQYGGSAVEGMQLVDDFDCSSTLEAFVKFKNSFIKRYQKEPIFAAARAYEAVMVLAQALAETGGDPQGLPQALVRIKNFTGPLGILSFDRFGDVMRQKYLTTVKSGAFVTSKTVP